MLLAASLAKASISFMFMSICLSLTLFRVQFDKQLHKVSYSLALIDMAYAFLSSDKRISSNTILAIDEPEASMHTSLCFEQFKRLSELAALYGHQVITATHWYGLLPMCQKGTLHHISTTKPPKIKSFSLSNLFEKRRDFPDDIEFKSVFDLVSSILSLMKNKKTNWLICEGSDDSMYFNYFIREKVENLVILPVGGCGNVVKIYNYLYGPMSENSEKDMINGKIVCLIDTDEQQGVCPLPSETKDKALILRRLQRKDNNVLLSKLGQGGTYKKTEIEDCLAPDCFYESTKRVINSYGTEEIKELFSEFSFNPKPEFSDINNHLCRFIEANTIEAHKETSKLIDYMQRAEIKFKIAREYIKEDNHDLKWINDLIKLF